MSNQPSAPAIAGGNAPVPFTIPNRTLARRGSMAGYLATLHLEDVRDYLRVLETKQQPIDFTRTLNQLHVDFTESHMKAKWLTAQGVAPGRAFLFSHTGAGQVAREVLPSRFHSGLRELAQMDPTGAKIATAAWAKFSLRNGDTPRLVRTVLATVGGEVRRVIRSCHSPTYGAYSNLAFVQDILDHGGQFADLPVLDWRLTDNGMRLRFSGVPQDQIELRKPLPMIEGFNSETGQSKTLLRGGSWKLVCTNGLGSWVDRDEFSWIHRGDVQRISNGVKDAYENLLTTASGVVRAYEDALNIAVDNIYEWMEDELKSMGAAVRVVEDAKVALDDETTTRGGRLASAVDAVTLIAQNEADIFQQRELERFAGRMLNKGRGVAARHGGRIPVGI